MLGKGYLRKKLTQLTSSVIVLILCIGGCLPQLQSVAYAADEKEIPQEGLIADYLFAEEPSDGITVQNLATGEEAAGDATVQNADTAVWEDHALVFSGEGRSVSNPIGTWVSLPEDILSGASSATISIEVKSTASIISQNHFLWNIGNSGTSTYWFMNTMAPRTSIKYNNGEKTAEASKLEADRWYNLTAVISADEKTISIYVDGNKKAETKEDNLSLLQVSDQSLNTIGRAPYDDALFQGAVAAFHVYDRALSSDEIKTISEADAAIHADYFEELALEQIQNMSEVTISDSRTTLPSYNGTVTWQSKTDDVVLKEDGLSAVVKQPAHGEAAVEGILTANLNLRGQHASADVKVVIQPEVGPDDPYGYLLVHFIEDSQGYAEKIYLDISQGDNPEYWEPLNGGAPILASNMGTTGVRDPFITYNPESETYYIIATDLRVFGADNAGWSKWQRNYSTKMNVWESKDLIHWSDLRQFDVARDVYGDKVANLGMMWAPEATWVDDYYGEGDGAFVVYWSSMTYADDDVSQKYMQYRKVLWGATKDFSQETYEYGGVLVDEGRSTIDTTIIQNEGMTYHVTKDEGNGYVYMQSTDAKEWWKEDTQWSTVQIRIGQGKFGGVEGPAMFKDHSRENTWYLFLDDMPTPGYQPMITNDLDKGWEYIDTSSYFLTPNTKHGGVISLTKAQYDAIRKADAKSVVTEDCGRVEVVLESDHQTVLEALPKTVPAELYYDYGIEEIEVQWDVESVDTNTLGEYKVTGYLETIGANKNQWSGKDGSTDWLAEDKQMYSSTVLTVEAVVDVVEELTPPEVDALPYVDVTEGDWFNDAVYYCYDEGLMIGMTQTSFGPYGQLSRAQFALILYRMAGEPEVKTDKTFADITGDEWYGQAVLWAADAKVVNGYENGCFGPADNITREQMALMMYRYANYLEKDTENEGDLSKFSDGKTVSPFATDALKWAADKGIITGKGIEEPKAIDPQGETARCEAAAIIQRFMK